MSNAVIIPHFNDHRRLERCLAGLSKNDLTDTDVVVIDNNSTEPLDNLMAAFPFARLVIEPQRGAAAARNRGVAETTAENLFFLDADCTPDADWVAVARRVIADNTVIGGRITVYDETGGPRTGAQAFETVFAFDQAAYIARHGFSVTANLLTTRTVFSAAGPFVVGVSEDLDWCFRATAGGARLIYCDDLHVSHPTRQDWPALRRKWVRTTREGFQLHRLTHGRLSWTLRAAVMPVSAVIHSVRVLTHPDLSSAQERLRGVATLFRLRCARAVWMLRQVVGRDIS